MLALFAAPTVTSTINAAVAATKALRRYRAQVVLDAVVNGERKHATYDIATDGGTAVVRIRKPERRNEAASDRTFYFGPSRLIAYDAVANERLTRPLPKGKSVVDRYTFALGPPDDMVKNLLDPNAMAEFLVSMRKMTGWSLRSDGGLRRVVRTAQGGSTILSFPPSDSPLLQRLDVTTGKNQVHWRFDYARGGPSRPEIPASARQVGAFTVSLVPPRYRNAMARRLSQKIVEAYRNLYSGEIIVDGEDGHVEIFLTGRRLRENQSKLTYAYDGARLEIKRANAYYAGAAVRRAVPDYVAELGARVDPISREILQSQVPFQEVFAPRSVVSYGGEMSIGGSSIDMLKVEFPGGRVSLYVRRHDHLLDAAITESLDGRGAVIARSARRFKYAMLGLTQPDARFVVSRPAGQTVLPLPRLKIGR